MIEISRTMLQWNNMLETHAVKPTNRPIDRWMDRILLLIELLYSGDAVNNKRRGE